MDAKQLLGKNLRALRVAKGISQDDLSEISGLHRTYLSGIERGVRNPTITIIEQLARSLNVSLEQLLQERV